MPLDALFTVTLYGSDEYFESDANSEVLKSDITGAANESKSIDCFILRPYHRIEVGDEEGGGNVQTNKTVIFQKYEIVTTRLNNVQNDYADITGLYTDLISVMNFKYHYLEVGKIGAIGKDYYYALHTAGNLIKGVFKKINPIFTSMRAYFEIDFEKERPE